MVWQNAMRYAFGVLDYWPLDWIDPAIGPWPFAIAMASFSIIVIFGITRVVMFVHRDRTITQAMQQAP